IRFFDEDGNIEIDPKVAKQYPGLVSYAKNLQSTYANKPQAFRKAFKEYSGLSDKQITAFVTYGQGPRVTVVQNLKDDKGNELNGATIQYADKKGNVVNSDENGKYKAGGGKGLIQLDNSVVGAYENAKTMGDKVAGEVLLESTLFHEGTHYGTGVNKSNENEYDSQGKEFEKTVYGEDVGRANAKRIASPELITSPPKPNYNQ
ncbi:MAG TPA: hypothetical protein VIJ27_10105, partial [Mucilaginibacter sp.]